MVWLLVSAFLNAVLCVYFVIAYVRGTNKEAKPIYMLSIILLLLATICSFIGAIS
jgi:hypothetical protein